MSRALNEQYDTDGYAQEQQAGSGQATGNPYWIIVLTVDKDVRLWLAIMRRSSNTACLWI